jgi:hypothetical protein
VSFTVTTAYRANQELLFGGRIKQRKAVVDCSYTTGSREAVFQMKKLYIGSESPE